MKTSLAALGLEFGKLAHLRGIITYKLSPYEQRAFAGIISHGFPNSIRRIRSKILIVVPPLLLGYMVYSEAEKEYARLMRKNPDDYKNDK